MNDMLRPWDEPNGGRSCCRDATFFGAPLPLR
jgi:hypothetical protein